mgnify:CR=1 FL=1
MGPLMPDIIREPFPCPSNIVRSGKREIVSAQIVGFNGVDKRIEMLAQVIQRGGTVHDLAELEHAYAPPYSSAKDPVNMAGFVAENILNKKSQIIQWRELAELPADTIRIDVRTTRRI